MKTFRKFNHLSIESNLLSSLRGGVTSVYGGSVSISNCYSVSGAEVYDCPDCTATASHVICNWGDGSCTGHHPSYSTIPYDC